MDAFLFLILFSSTLLSINAYEDTCAMMQCGDGAPKIQFPFQVKGFQLQHCGHPGFELVCKDNTTFIPFPSYNGDLVVKTISYPHQKLVSSSFSEIPCLSGSKYHVYTVEPSLAIPNSCRPVKTVAIPFQYSPYLADNSFGLGLSWDLPGSEDCEANGGHCGLKDKTGCFNLAHDIVFSIGIFIFAMVVATVTIIRIYHSKKIHCQDEEKYSAVVEKLGDYNQILKPSK
ncbi:ring-h2 finger protein atl22 [Quercus suber]|uniref:RING-type E3 ubiquitin transferase n=1 Tax=Quercus suber TaxID=58331 RepID=A0AAW0JXU6_QUESU